MEFIEVAMHSPRNPRLLVRLRLPRTFTQYRQVDVLAPIVVDIMKRRAFFTANLLCSAGFAAIQLATLDADNRKEVERGRAMLQAVKAILLPGRQPVICSEALELIREINPEFSYPCGCRHA
jgi:methylmalonyl-CoA mutase cobalamin-binding subunit